MSRSVEHLVLMGVSGCGKTTAALNLHNALGWPVAEADDFHPGANIDKMSRGVALTDEDRWPWLKSMRDWMSERATEDVKTIVTCSALKRSYRDLLSGAQGRVFFIHLLAQPDELQERMAHREGHFMPSSLCPTTRTASPWSRGRRRRRPSRRSSPHSNRHRPTSAERRPSQMVADRRRRPHQLTEERDAQPPHRAETGRHAPRPHSTSPSNDNGDNNDVHSSSSTGRAAGR